SETANLDFEETGNELIALLKESADIKHLYPKHNRAQKRTIQQYGIFSYEDRNGILHLAFNKIKLTPNPFSICYSPTEARQFLETVCETYKLCPKYCHLQENIETCSHYKIKQCIGICSDTALKTVYNEKVNSAIANMTKSKADCIIQQKGRNSEENSFILISDTTYVGYGYVPKEIAIQFKSDLDPYLIRQNNTLETQRILESFIRKHPEKVKEFREEQMA
ncbi:MAG: DNA polymerase III subunit epsilon, partial [Maribacter sp.]